MCFTWDICRHFSMKQVFQSYDKSIINFRPKATTKLPITHVTLPKVTHSFTDFLTKIMNEVDHLQ